MKKSELIAKAAATNAAMLYTSGLKNSTPSAAKESHFSRLPRG
jgi:hypothetical protein